MTGSSVIVPVEGLGDHVCRSRSECARTGDPLVDAIVQSPTTKKNIDHPVVDRNHDVPYGAGGSEPLEDPTTYLDRHVPLRMTVPRKTGPGLVSFDPAEPYVIHENSEQTAMEALIRAGVDPETAYKFSHYEVAERAEGAWYAAHDVDRAEAERQEDVFLRQIQHEDPRDPPPNLYTKPYPHHDIWMARHEKFEEARPTEAEKAECRPILGRVFLKDDSVAKSAPGLERRQRDAFGYMEPSPDVPDFAQCSSCRSWLADKKNCYWFATDDRVEGDDSCILYVQGTPVRFPEVYPVAALRPETVSFASGQVRCENCDSSRGGECGFFARLNEAWPEAFDLDTAIEPRGCCNAFGRAVAVAKAAPPVRAAGVAYVAPDGHVLFVRRAGSSDYPGTWCLPGGCVEDGETFAEAAAREFQEETGGSVDPASLVEVAHRDDPAGADYVTFLGRGPRFEPALDDESDGAIWAPTTDYPRPMHPGFEPVMPLVAAAARGGDPMETFLEPVEKAWSDAAREAAAEARENKEGYEDLHHFLNGKSQVPGVGKERGTVKPNGVSHLVATGSPKGYEGHRFVHSEGGKIVAAMQVTKTPSTRHTVANVYVHPDYRRRGLGSKLHAEARKKFGEMDWTDRSPAGEALRTAVNKADTVSTATGLVSRDQSSASRPREEDDVPWKTNADLPDGVKNSLPSEAQDVFRSVANRVKAGGGTDESAMRQAWTAVKNGWHKQGDEWVRKAWSDEAREAAAEARHGKTQHVFGEGNHELHQWAVNQVDESASRRDWSSLPSHFEADAVGQVYDKLKPHFDKKTGIAHRVAASKATTHDELRAALQPRGGGTKSADDEMNKGATDVGNQQISFFMPLTKKEPQADGSVVVTGYASTPTRDLDGEVIALDAVKKALPDYMNWRNVRAMHKPDAVGTAREAHVDDVGLYLKARIVEPGAVHLVKEGVYQGFSIGGRKLAKSGDTVTALELVEISIVDRPCNPDTRFAIAKGAKVINPRRIDLVKVADEDGVTFTREELGVFGKILAKLGVRKTAEQVRSVPDHRPEPSAAPEEGEGMDVEKKEFSDEKRGELADQGHAMPDGSFPVESEQDLRNAIQAHGRAKDPAKAKRHIVRQARRLGATNILPEGWSGGGKAADAEDLKKAANLYTVSQMIELLGRLEYLEEVCEGEDNGFAVAAGMGTYFAPSKEFTDKFGSLLTQFADCTADLLDQAIAQMKDEEAEEAKEAVAGTADIAKAWSEEAREAAAEARRSGGHPKGWIEAHGIRGMQGKPWRGVFRSPDHLNDWAERNDSVEVHATRDADHDARLGMKKGAEEGDLALDPMSQLAAIAKGAEVPPTTDDDPFADLRRSFSIH